MTRQVKGGTIRATCSQGHTVTAPNKGLGRAKVAAWKSRHQHAGQLATSGAADTPGHDDEEEGKFPPEPTPEQVERMSDAPAKPFAFPMEPGIF